MDASVLMDRVEVLKDWPNRKDSDIAQEIFDTYGLSFGRHRHSGDPRRGRVDDHPGRDRHAVPQATRAAQRIRVLRVGRDRILRPARPVRRRHNPS